MIAPLLAVLGLWFLQTLLATSIQYLGDPSKWSANLAIALRARDVPPPMPVMGARAQRAQANLQESMFPFLTLALLLEHRGDPGTLGLTAAWVFFGARVLYVPAYLSAIPGLRSTVWMVAVGALLAMVVALLG